MRDFKSVDRSRLACPAACVAQTDRQTRVQTNVAHSEQLGCCATHLRRHTSVRLHGGTIRPAQRGPTQTPDPPDPERASAVYAWCAPFPLRSVSNVKNHDAVNALELGVSFILFDAAQQPHRCCNVWDRGIFSKQKVPRETGAACAPRGHAYNSAHAGSNRRAVRGRPRTRHPHGDGWEGQPSGPPMGPDQSVGPGGLATPGTGGCLRALPQQSDALLAFRADGAVVWSTDVARPSPTLCRGIDNWTGAVMIELDNSIKSSASCIIIIIICCCCWRLQHLVVYNKQFELFRD
eukprot:scaffold59036_cov62-Phaeocystis_antarctica.AAC.1